MEAYRVVRCHGSYSFPGNQLIDGGEAVSRMHPPCCTAQEDSWYSFLLEVESTPAFRQTGTW
jgi:hypothetical protein